MTALEKFDNARKRAEASHFFSQAAGVPAKSILFLKTLTDDKAQMVLEKAKKILNSNWCFGLAFFKNQLPYDFNRLDTEGIVAVPHCHYEIYRITDSQQNSWFLIVQHNNFFPDGNNMALAHLKINNHYGFLWRLFF